MLKRALCLLLALLHLATFGPMREAFAYSATSTNYKLTTGSPTQGGANRGLNGDKILKDAIGEPCAQSSTSTNYALSSGFIPTLQSNPPEAKHIPPQFWQKNTAKTDVFDLDDYFSSPDGLDLTYTFEKLNPDPKINITMDPVTHIVSFSQQQQDYSGTEKVQFKATDSEGDFVLSNKVALQVLGDKNQPVIDEITIEPANFKQGDLITLTIKAIDMDGDDLSFSYTPEGFFKEVEKKQDPQDPKIWYSTATWQTTPQHQGYYSVGIKVTDSTGLFDTDSMDLRLGVDNHPPKIKKINGKDVTAGQPVALTAKEGELFVFNIEVEDPDKNTITLSYFWPQEFDNPHGDEGKWDIPYTVANSSNPSVSKTIAVTASDRIDFDTATVVLAVENTNRAPQASLFLSKYTLLKNEEFTIKLEAFDRDGDELDFILYKDGDKLVSGRIAYNEPYTATTSFADNGKHTISAVITDSAGLFSPSSSKEVDVTDVDINVNPLLGDYNGDALTDLGIFNYKTGEWKIALSKEGAFESAGSWLSNFGASDSGEWIPVGGDFNGDGLMDVGSYNSISGELKIALSTSSSFAKQDQPWLKFPEASYKKRYCETHEVCSGFWIFESCEDVEVCSEYPYSPWQPFTGNFNADKYTDFALYNKDSGEVKIALGTGSGFKPFTTWLNVSDSHKDSIALAGDFNGDSLADLLLFNKSTGETRVLFSNTKEFVDESDWTPSGFSVKDKDLILSDFNNDGLTDIGYWDKASSKWYYAVSKGDKFAVINNGIWLEGFGSKDAESASTGDFNGDGLTDAAVFDKEELGIKCWSTRASTNKPADLLTDIINGIGGKTKVTYSYASSENQDYLPFPVYVTSSVSSVNTVPVERQASYTQNFSYTGGFFDAAEREFRGFHYVKVTDPITQNYTQTQFYQGREDLKQDGALKGQIEQVEAYDGNSRLISRVENKYTVAKEGREDKAYLGFPALTKQITTVNEENNQYIKTENTFSYDAIGNPLEQSNDITEYSSSVTVKPGSKKTTQTTYAQAYTYNTVSKSGLNRPLQTALLDKDNKEVSKKSFSYDSKGNLLKEKVFIFNPFTADYGLSTVDYTYDSFGNLITTTNTKGHQVTTEYETKFYAFPVKVTNALGQSISYTYDPKLGVVLSVTDTNNATTTSHYDSLGRLLYAENALGQVPTRYEYPDPNFNRKITKQLDLKTGEYVEVKTELIDGLGRKYRTITVGEDGDKAKNVVSETFYNERGLVDRESLPHYEIDTADQISQIVYVRYVYDIRGRITKTYSDFSPSSPSPTARYYPAFEQQFSPEGKDATAIINYGPNDSSPLYTETLTPDPEHNQEHKKGTLKDIYGNVLEVTEFTRDGDFKTKYEYDIQNNLVKVIDSQGQDKFTRGKAPNITQIFYDSVGRKIKMLDPDMGEWSYEYDLLGNLIRQTDAKGQALEFEYDALNRLVRKYANPVPGTPNPEASGFRVQGSGGRNILATYIYDDPAKENCIGRLSKVVDQSGSTEFFYDVLGREIKSIKSLRGGVAFPVSLRGASAASDEAISYTVQREYDLFDRLTKLTYPDGEAVSYTYDTNSGLPEKVFTVDRGLSTVDYVSDITYNAKGQIKNIQYGNNTKTDYTYGQDLRLEHILTQKQGLSPQGTVPVSGAALQDLYYDFDSNGNLSTLTDNLRSNTRAYRYDDLDRLTEAQNSPIPNGGLGTFRYEYDSIGNMRSQTVSGTATVFMDYGQNAGPHALTSSAGYSYRYDQNGNMIQGKNKTLEYDAENRLTQVTEGSTITSFSYDGDGGRVKKSTVHSQQSTETTYIGSLFEIDSSGKTTKHIFAGANRVCSIEGVVSVKALTSRGVVPDAQRLSPPTQMPAPASTQASTFPRQELRKASSEPKISYYHSDHLGSSNVISDKDGALVQKIEYAPYGAIASTEPRTPNPVPKYLYTGKELDGTGLYYYGARYYDPEIGRFITPDTIVQAPYDPQSFNRYSYCRNNPINYIDPTGHKWSWGKFWSSFVGAVLGVIVTAVTGGLGAPFWLAGMYGGMAGGALTGGLQGGWQGALMGAAIGGVLGAAGGWAAGGGHYWAMAGMFAAGVGVAAATNSWDSFAGGIAGAAVGTLAGAGILSAYKEQFGNFRAGDGFRSNAAVKNINAQKALQVDIKKGYNDLKNTRWAKTEDGKAVVRDVGKAINKGDVTLENLPPGTRADYLNGKIRLNSQNSQAEIPGRLVHEGTHMLQDQRGELGVYDFPDERAAFNAGYAVDQETNVYGAYNPTDNEIRTWYKPYFDI